MIYVVKVIERRDIIGQQSAGRWLAARTVNRHDVSPSPTPTRKEKGGGISSRTLRVSSLLTVHNNVFCFSDGVTRKLWSSECSTENIYKFTPL